MHGDEGSKDRAQISKAAMALAHSSSSRGQLYQIQLYMAQRNTSRNRLRFQQTKHRFLQGDFGTPLESQVTTLACA